MLKEVLARGVLELMERRWLPDRVTRSVMRRLLEQRRSQFPTSPAERAAAVTKFAEQMAQSPMALVPEKANEQHYEVPAELYRWMLGPRRKYSSCFYDSPTDSLATAEATALRLTCEHAELADWQHVLELGCGWGSLTLWMLEHYPHLQVTAVSNSASQRTFIETAAAERGWSSRLQVITADMNHFGSEARFAQAFDRVVSVEMFEHMRNYRLLLERIARWLRPDGKLLVHIFCHRDMIYPFETTGTANWMGRYFFSGGIMPSADIFSRFPTHMRVCREWRWNGLHYARTAEHWVAEIDRNEQAILPILANTYGAREARRWLQRWRMLFLAGAEMFALHGGEEWLVGHYLLEPVPSSADLERKADVTLAPEPTIG